MNKKSTMKTQKITIKFYLNGQLQKNTVSAGITVLDMLHKYHKAFGTKIGCKEGDCGSCTVAIGEWIYGHFVYQSVASCIYPAEKLYGKHLITIEGLSRVDSLSLIQKKIVNHHGVQCGYCTPGIIMSFFCLFAMKSIPTKKEISLALEGNICRCTGYEGIRKAGLAVVEQLKNNPEDWESKILPFYAKEVEQILYKLNQTDSFVPFMEVDSAVSNNRENDPMPVRTYHVPKTIEEFFSITGKLDNSTVIAGGTDLYVSINAGRLRPENLVDITRIEGLAAITVLPELIRIGSQARISRIIEHKELVSTYPIFKTMGDLVASRQIRNTATIAGNIANASPIGDFSVLLLALGASVELQSSKGKRSISLSDFFISYKKTALQKHEIITAVVIPVRPSMYVFFEKSSKRKAVDIASVNSCCAVELNSGKIISFLIAFGGIAPIPVVVTDTYDFTGKLDDDKKIFAFANKITKQFSVISDIRGSKKFRTLLIRNHIIKHLGQLISLMGEDGDDSAK